MLFISLADANFFSKILAYTRTPQRQCAFLKGEFVLGHSFRDFNSRSHCLWLLTLSTLVRNRWQTSVVHSPVNRRQDKSLVSNLQEDSTLLSKNLVLFQRQLIFLNKSALKIGFTSYLSTDFVIPSFIKLSLLQCFPACDHKTVISEVLSLQEEHVVTSVLFLSSVYL